MLQRLLVFTILYHCKLVNNLTISSAGGCRQGVVDNSYVLVVSVAIVIDGGNFAVFVAVDFGRTVTDNIDRRCVVWLDAGIAMLVST